MKPIKAKLLVRTSYANEAIDVWIHAFLSNGVAVSVIVLWPGCRDSGPYYMGRVMHVAYSDLLLISGELGTGE